MIVISSLPPDWLELSKRRYHAVEKGIPVRWTGRPRGHYKARRAGGSTGVSGGSRILAHQYMDDGDNGKAHRRNVRRSEREMWMRDVYAEYYGF